MPHAVFQTTISEHQMLCRGDGVVAALSGGPDSTALICLLLDLGSQWRLRVYGAHFNHGLRGAESDEDEAFVRRQCRRLGVPFASARAANPPRGENIEQWAREHRYRFLERIRADLGLGKVALGHTRDDLAETFLMRLIRGSGLTGLACLRPVREDGVIRPMIGMTRADVLSYLEERGEPYRRDSSNLDTGRVRNRVRHELLPLLERKYNPRIMERLSFTAGLIRDDEDQLERAAARELARLCAETEGDGFLELSCRELTGLPAALARRVVRGALRDCLGHLRRIDRAHVEAVIRLAAANLGGEKRLDLPGEVVVRVSYDRLIFEAVSREEVPGWWSRTLEIPGRTLLEECGLEAVATLGPGPSTAQGWPDTRTTALLDAEAVGVSGLLLRSWRPGDRYRPAGAPGSRKISRMLIDHRVPRHRRGMVPVLVSGDQPIWLPGRLPAAGLCWLADAGGPCLRIDLCEAGGPRKGRRPPG